MPTGIISAIYKSIFDDDPLLLIEDNQVEYGKAMLQHLLVYRPMTTSEPHPIDLHNPAIVARSKRAPKVFPQPPADVLRRYKQARRMRGTIEEQDFEDLKKVTMVADGEPTHRRRFSKTPSPSNLPTHDAALKALREINEQTVGLFNKRFRLAAVGYRLKVSLVENGGYVSEELCAQPEIVDAPVPGSREKPTESQLGRTRSRPRKRLQPWEDSILAHITKALDRRSDVVVLPEFALPTATGSKTEMPITDRIRQVCIKAEARDFFLFAGTRHEERYNRGYILSKRNAELSNDHWHYKVASARSLGENIMGPFGKSLPSYLASFKIGTAQAFITVAVCYDTYDPSTFLNIVLEAVNSFGKEKPKVILVPSFNPSDDFVALLRDISFLARCTVVYVNALHGDAKMFVCGFAISDFAIKENFERLIRSIQENLVKLPEENTSFQFESGWGNVKITTSPKTYGSTPEQKRKILDRLLQRLQSFDDMGRLDNMVTIESCAKCESGKHGIDDHHCGRDLLYYNLDFEFIEALTEFRRFFYGEEEFLPLPLQFANLQDAVKKLVAA